jgi:hypothetical protein
MIKKAANSRGGSLGKATACPERLFAWLVRNVERLVEELEYYRVHAGSLELVLCHKDGRVTLGKVRQLHSDRFEPLLETAKVALRQAYIPKIPVSAMHLTATELRWPGSVQLGLFEMPAPKAAALAKLKREVNARFGRFTLRSGATLPLSDIYRDESASYDICDVHGKMCF